LSNVYIAANSTVISLTNDNYLNLISANIRFPDDSVQTKAYDPTNFASSIQDSVLFYNSITKDVTYDVIGNLAYSPNNISNYDGTVTTIKEALDELAARLRNAGF
jgi:hypothetical protein